MSINIIYIFIYKKKYIILIYNSIFKIFKKLYTLYFAINFLSFIKQIINKLYILFFPFISFKISITLNNGKLNINIFILQLS